MTRLKLLTKKYGRWWVPISLLLGLAAWQTLVLVANLPVFTLPSPAVVVERALAAIVDGTLPFHAAFTLLEVLLGLLLGVSLASVIGYAVAKSHLLERLLSPYLVASQATPVVAIAPLLVIWFGPSIFSKVLICALTVFFPVLVNTIVGLRAVPQNLRDLMVSMHATPSQMLRHLELPAALPVLLGGLRVGATLSVIGAVVGEFVGSDRGLGFLINVARGQYDMPLVFAAVLTLVTLALGLYGIVVLFEKKLLSWNQ